jgi:hypothetical protein
MHWYLVTNENHRTNGFIKIYVNKFYMGDAGILEDLLIDDINLKIYIKIIGFKG